MSRKLTRWFNHAPMTLLWVITVALIVVFVAAMYALGVVLVMWAWNVLIHDLFGGPVIEWWHALALLVLLSVISACFKGSSSGNST